MTPVVVYTPGGEFLRRMEEGLQRTDPSSASSPATNKLLQCRDAAQCTLEAVTSE